MKDGNWTFPSILAMVEGGNASMMIHMNKSDKSFKSLQGSKGKRLPRRSSLISSADSYKGGSVTDAFAKLYNSKAASSYRKIIAQRVTNTLTSKLLV